MKRCRISDSVITPTFIRSLSLNLMNQRTISLTRLDKVIMPEPNGHKNDSPEHKGYKNDSPEHKRHMIDSPEREGHWIDSPEHKGHITQE